VLPPAASQCRSQEKFPSVKRVSAPCCWVDLTSSDECFFWGLKRYSELQNKFPETERRRSNLAEIQNAKILETNEVSILLIFTPKENFRANWS
jgi:hypothetical protein